MDMVGKPWFVMGSIAPAENKTDNLVDQDVNEVFGDTPDVKGGSSACWRPMSVGTDGPNISKSSTPTRIRRPRDGGLCIARENARLTVRHTSELAYE